MRELRAGEDIPVGTPVQVDESGVVTGLAQTLNSYADLLSVARLSPDGALAAFVSEDDGHSPVVLPHYRELESYLSAIATPLILVDARDPGNARGLDECQVYSVPTLCWIKADDLRTHLLMRVVGTVTYRKLEVEADRVIDRLYPDVDE